MNNMAEYEALILGLKMALGVKACNLLAFGDSEFVIKQFSGTYEVKHENLRGYHREILSLMKFFDNISFQHIPRS